MLVVEDEYLIALEAQRMLEEAGAAQVLLASSINEVLKLIADGPRVDAAVLDLMLGNEDAAILIAKFRNRGIPFLITTGFETAAPEGVTWLSKPYTEAELIAAIGRLFGRT